MIEGIGVDIVKVERLRQAAGRWGKRFLEKVFTEREIKYCMEKHEPFTSFAIRFAAKEALIKALGQDGFGLKEIEVLNRPDGSPFISPGEGLKRVLLVKGVKKLHLSLSHEKEFGVAFVVAERE
jgi:holo-[acyl-carrier protein] synthase